MPQDMTESEAALFAESAGVPPHLREPAWEFYNSEFKREITLARKRFATDLNGFSKSFRAATQLYRLGYRDRDAIRTALNLFLKADSPALSDLHENDAIRATTGQAQKLVESSHKEPGAYAEVLSSSLLHVMQWRAALASFAHMLDCLEDPATRELDAKNLARTAWYYSSNFASAARLGAIADELDEKAMPIEFPTNYSKAKLEYDRALPELRKQELRLIGNLSESLKRHGFRVETVKDETGILSKMTGDVDVVLSPRVKRLPAAFWKAHTIAKKFGLKNPDYGLIMDFVGVRMVCRNEERLREALGITMEARRIPGENVIDRSGDRKLASGHQDIHAYTSIGPKVTGIFRRGTRVASLILQTEHWFREHLYGHRSSRQKYVLERRGIEEDPGRLRLFNTLTKAVAEGRDPYGVLADEGINDYLTTVKIAHAGGGEGRMTVIPATATVLDAVLLGIEKSLHEKSLGEEGRLRITSGRKEIPVADYGQPAHKHEELEFEIGKAGERPGEKWLGHVNSERARHALERILGRE